MFYHKTGIPEEGEVVMCTVTKIQYSSVFADIDDYGISGMIHISEIAAGRIRNIRDYVKEGKKVVCKILRVNRERGFIDLSLRRVPENLRRSKVNDIKQEQKAETIIEMVAKQQSLEPRKVYDDFARRLLKDYQYIYHAFEDMVAGNLELAKEGIDPKLAAPVTELVMQRFKPKIVEIGGILKLSSYESDGIAHVRQALTKALDTPGLTLTYLGGGKYSVVVKAGDYKEAEPLLKSATEKVLEDFASHKGIGEFLRVEKKVKTLSL